MDTLPVFLKLKDQPCLLAGSGLDLSSKLTFLVKAGARVSLATDAPKEWNFSPDLTSIPLVPLREADRLVPRMRLVILAGLDDETTRRLTRIAHQAGVWINAVDRADLSSVLFGAIVDRSPVVVAVSSGGSAPSLSQIVRQKIEALLPASLGDAARFADHLRPTVARHLETRSRRRQFWRRFFTGPIADALQDGDRNRAMDLASADLTRDTGHPPGRLVVLDVATDDPENMTMKAARLLFEADVVVADDAVLSLVRNYTRRDVRHVQPRDAQNQDFPALLTNGETIVWLVRPGSTSPHIPALNTLRASGVEIEVASPHPQVGFRIENGSSRPQSR